MNIEQRNLHRASGPGGIIRRAHSTEWTMYRQLTGYYIQRKW